MTMTIIFETLDKIKSWADSSQIDSRDGWYVIKNARDGLFYYFRKQEQPRGDVFKLEMSSSQNLLFERSQ